MQYRSSSLCVLLAPLLMGVACSGPLPEEGNALPDVLKVAVLPDQAEDELRRQHEPLIAYLGETTGLESRLIIPASYDELIERFEAKDLDLAWFGGLTFLGAEESARAEPLVMRDVDLEFTTNFLVAGAASGQSIEDFAGKTLAFGPSLSTSGHLMPRFFLQQRGFEPEVFFGGLRHSAGHDQTAEWVQEGKVDIGAVNSVVAEAMFRNGQLAADRVRVLWTTPPYRNYVWAVQPDLATSLRIRLLDAFLRLDKRVPEQAAILSAQGANGYVPASRSDFADLRSAAALMSGETPQ